MLKVLARVTPSVLLTILGVGIMLVGIMNLALHFPLPPDETGHDVMAALTGGASLILIGLRLRMDA